VGRSLNLSDHEKAIFNKRINRFTIECFLNNRRVIAYLPNPGRLMEILLPGREIYLLRNPFHSRRNTEYTAIVALKDSMPILLHTHHANTVVQMLITEGKIPGFKGYSVVRQEFNVGNSRFDFLLRKGRRNLVLEVKSCTLFGAKVAMFPDAITHRGTRHLEELARLSDSGVEAGILFLVHNPSVRYFMPAYHIDLEFARTLCNLRDKLKIKAVAIKWNRDLSLGESVKELKIPWGLIETEADDGGSYIVILNLKRDSICDIKGLGRVSFKKGFYLYVGSAKRNLTKRIERHRRTRKRLYWHIDYLRKEAEFYSALPVRSKTPLECEIARSLIVLSEWTVPGFGSSDCKCKTHLFGMRNNPLSMPEFIEIVQYFRIDRLENILSGGGA